MFIAIACEPTGVVKGAVTVKNFGVVRVNSEHFGIKRTTSFRFQVLGRFPRLDRRADKTFKYCSIAVLWENNQAGHFRIVFHHFLGNMSQFGLIVGDHCGMVDGAGEQLASLHQLIV